VVRWGSRVRLRGGVEIRACRSADGGRAGRKNRGHAEHSNQQDNEACFGARGGANKE
jgi:hypothetical protein